jgi:hypothetical protein
VGGLGESRLGRVTKMLVVVEVRGRVEVFLLTGRIGAVRVGVLSCQIFALAREYGHLPVHRSRHRLGSG